MPSKYANYFNNTGYSLCIWLAHRYAVLIVIAAFSTVLLFAGEVIDDAVFSPDSWAYFELSKTVFGDSFYKFNTVRSYFSSEYSASFPLGYPVALASVQAVIGEYPFTAVIVNICVSMITIFVFSKICNFMRLGNMTWLALSCSLLYYPGYLDEVFAGRAIPLAVLIFTSSYYAFLARHFFFSGLLLGFTALVRYDFLVFALLFQFAAFTLKSVRFKDKLNLLGGFILGLSPWALYSFIHFGKLWVSDNSWVAISALPAFARDYPAEPMISVFDSPEMWLRRVLGNLPALLNSVIRSSIKFPLLVVFSVVAVFKRSFYGTISRHKLILAVFILLASFVPYLLTGYFDNRYFVLIFLASSFALLCIASGAEEFSLLNINYNGLIVISLIMCIFWGGLYISKRVYYVLNNKMELYVQNQKIDSLLLCHKKNPDHILIFTDETAVFGRKYGALTGMKVASLPSNFDKMKELERDQYFESMGQFILVSKLSGVDECKFD